MKRLKPIACLSLFIGLTMAGCVPKSQDVLGGGQNSAAEGQDTLGNFSPELGQNLSATPGSSEDFQTNLSNTVHFTTDSAQLTPEAKTILTSQAAWMKTYGDTNFSLQGHSDERGTREYNISLSARRANSVKSFLQNQGIASHRLSIIAFGKERPIEVCAQARCWNKNRRVETVMK